MGSRMSPVKTTLAKVGCDQLGFAPVFNGTFLVVLGATQGNSMDQINSKIKAEYVDVMLANWKVRPEFCPNR